MFDYILLLDQVQVSLDDFCQILIAMIKVQVLYRMINYGALATNMHNAHYCYAANSTRHKNQKLRTNNLTDVDEVKKSLVLKFQRK